MANRYTWNFPELDVYKTAQNGHVDAIKAIHYRFTAVSDTYRDFDGIMYYAIKHGSVEIDVPAADEDFIAFNDITKDWCKQKVLAALGQTEDELRAELDLNIVGRATGTTVEPDTTPRLPSSW